MSEKTKEDVLQHLGSIHKISKNNLGFETMTLCLLWQRFWADHSLQDMFMKQLTAFSAKQSATWNAGGELLDGIKNLIVSLLGSSKRHKEVRIIRKEEALVRKIEKEMLIVN
ncbi:hypothetical protein CERZMDRAFT_99710 [Cercospora zeae-maydis SCOH1-5]|uniref:Uncharacterized protein n=1 Tax=Cercospora zeae-maydis SCOH1-5 TaxID=717836 RepID=A0A6A6FA77_9PEZI|nr:hypothetical protein CERZMDRAFT_99710 [Cercospora zeae-maydis SCOH1-5]